MMQACQDTGEQASQGAAAGLLGFFQAPSFLRIEPLVVLSHSGSPSQPADKSGRFLSCLRAHDSASL